MPFADPEQYIVDQPAQHTTEDTKPVTIASLEKELAEKIDTEAKIRGEADPDKRYSRDTIDTACLVKNIRKRHRDNIEEIGRERNAMRMEREHRQRRFDDEKKLLCRKHTEALRSRDEQAQQTHDEIREVNSKYSNLKKENEAKDKRIAKLEKQVKETIETGNSITKSSVEALGKQKSQMDYKITSINAKYRQELTETREWNAELQERLTIARRWQPVYIFHRAQVGTVCEMYEKLVQMKKEKQEELAAKDKKNEELRGQIGYQKREIDALQVVAEADGEVLNKTAEALRNTRKALSEAEGKIRSHQREVKDLERSEKTWENAYRAKMEACLTLRSQMRKMQADHHMELIRAQAENEGLKTSIGFLQEANDKMDNELEAWESGHSGRVQISEPKHNETQTGGDARSLAKALKAANARADTLQLSVNASKAERASLERQLGNAANSYSPQLQEQLERLQNENSILKEASGEVSSEAAALKMELLAQFAEEKQKLETRFADRTQELENGFNQGFDNLRKLRDQWLLHKRALEEQHNREMVTTDLQRETERQFRADQLEAVFKEKEAELRLKENDLERAKTELANQVRSLHASGQNLVTMQRRAEKAEQAFLQLQVTTANDRSNRDVIDRMQNDEIERRMRNGQRHLDVLNEETSKMAGGFRILDLHNELQNANCSMDYFKFAMDHLGANRETLLQALYGADFNDWDVQLLQQAGRPVLLAQLQAAKRTMDKLRAVLNESPDVNVGMALSILIAPRGDENAAPAPDDIFAESSEAPENAFQRKDLKRSRAPLDGPIYGDHENNTASDDWGIQSEEGSTANDPSTLETIANRPKLLLKSRRIGAPAKPVLPENIDPAIRDQ